MTNKINPSMLPGFMELLPGDQVEFNAIKKVIEETFEEFSFFPLDTPIIEKSEILLSKGGGETTKQIYSIESDTKNMALRFDLTVPLARYVSQHYHELNFPFRRYHIGKVYRGERNQRGRYKEFYQCDIDIVGDEHLDLFYEAEIPLVIYNVFSNMNFTGITFHMNNRKLLNGLMQSLEIEDSEEVLRVIDKKAKVDEEKFSSMLMDVIKDEEKLSKLLDFLSITGSNQTIIGSLENLAIENSDFKLGLDEIKKVYSYMVNSGIKEENILIDLTITRGLDYYTGSVFETFIDGHEDIGSICSGGRYDDLASNFTDKKLPGIGMSIGLSRLFYKLQEEKLLEIENRKLADVLILTMGIENDYAIKLLSLLRANKIKSILYADDVKFKKKMNYANNLQTPFVIIIGEDELKNNQVSIKDMVSGSQTTINYDQVVSYLNKNL